MSRCLISPSMLSADFARLSEEAERVDGAADWLHVDVMDNHFVPNLTLGLPVVEALLKSTTIPVDCHLMIEEPDRWAPAYAEAGINYGLRLAGAMQSSSVGYCYRIGASLYRRIKLNIGAWQRSTGQIPLCTTRILPAGTFKRTRKPCATYCDTAMKRLTRRATSRCMAAARGGTCIKLCSVAITRGTFATSAARRP